MQIRFLEKSEYLKTLSLSEECFTPDEDIYRYYESEIMSCRIAAAVSDGRILSMAHLKRFTVCEKGRSYPAWYIMFVATSPESRCTGLMNKVMRFVLDTLKCENEHMTFLIPVDKRIYERLGFKHFWRFNESERDMLYSEDDLTECAACVLDGKEFTAPERILPV